jgi:hypothetical protein
MLLVPIHSDRDPVRKEHSKGALLLLCKFPDWEKYSPDLNTTDEYKYLFKSILINTNLSLYLDMIHSNTA